ncbi:hypothetical protein PARMER_03923 [Parabacteroides merdae ATCC 43184]|nr:hypothetical protein PARMER_03923 [Parabacteroides merdae ATCC 43184]
MIVHTPNPIQTIYHKRPPQKSNFFSFLSILTHVYTLQKHK